MIDDFHFIHVAVAALAGNPAVHVRGVVEVNVIRSLMNPHPLDRLAVIAWIVDVHGLVKRSQFRAVPLNVLMAVPASATGGNVRVTRDINEGMAVTAIQTQLIDVDFVGKWNWLGRLITHNGRLWRGVVSERQCNTRRYGPGADSDLKR